MRVKYQQSIKIVRVKNCLHNIEASRQESREFMLQDWGTILRLILLQLLIEMNKKDDR